MREIRLSGSVAADALTASVMKTMASANRLKCPFTFRSSVFGEMTGARNLAFRCGPAMRRTIDGSLAERQCAAHDLPTKQNLGERQHVRIVTPQFPCRIGRRRHAVEASYKLRRGGDGARRQVRSRDQGRRRARSQPVAAR